jgi:RNA polymerase sigma factor (TIGR02999 family)
MPESRGLHPGELTELLRSWHGGDRAALDRIMPVVYDELRSLAGRHLARERDGHTLQTTALVHEAYLKLIDQTRAKFESRAHFLAVAAQAMRRILVDHARTRGRLKRGGAQERVALDDAALVGGDPDLDLVALDGALRRLADHDERKARAVEMRFFGGMTVEEIAQAQGVGTATVKRDWEFARTWLLREMTRA